VVGAAHPGNLFEDPTGSHTCLQAKLIPGCTIFVSMHMRCSIYIVVSMNMFCAIAFYIVSPLENLLKPIHNFWNFGIPKSA
jgi:hypothetical protein